MVEKPKPDEAPSNLYINGRYILQPRDLRPSRASRQRGAGGEIQLTDAMIRLSKDQPFYGCRYNGRTYRLRLQGRLPRRQCRLRARPQGSLPPS